MLFSFTIVKELKENKNIDNNKNKNINNNIVIITNDSYDGTDINDTDTIDNKEIEVKKSPTKLKMLFNLLSRPCGAGMEELEEALDWKKASIIGII